MSKDDLLALREQFRQDFQAHDWCIGESRCEAFFRQLLGEPEPEPEPRIPRAPAISREEMNALMKLYTDAVADHLSQPSPLLGALKRE